MNRTKQAYLQKVEKAWLICIFSLFFSLGSGMLRAQSPGRFEHLAQRLDSLSRSIPGLNAPSDLALSDVPLSDYLRAIGKVHRINVYIDNTPNKLITNNFLSEPVKNIFLFVCKKFDLDIQVTGTILNFVPYKVPPQITPPPPPKKLKISWADSLLSFDLKNDSLSKVLRKVSHLSGRTLITRPGAQGLLSGFIPPSPFEQALENVLFQNGFVIERHRKGFYIVSKVNSAPNGKNGNASTSTPGLNDSYVEVARDSAGKPFIFIQAENSPLDPLIRELFAQLKLPFQLMEPLEGKTSLHMDGGSTAEVLHNLLRGTDYTWKRSGDLYLIGSRQGEGLLETRIINLKYRPSEKVIELIPTQLKEGLELKEFVELNRIIVAGEAARIHEVEAFVREIDRPVPMVKIEMMVVDVDFSKLLSAGVSAGLRSTGDSLSAVKSLFPGIEYTLDGSAINGILASTGLGAALNMGTLRSNFYLTLKAQESRGNLKIITRPVISTLNGVEANITIGQTDYYLLQTQTNAAGAVNAFNQVSQRYERIEINTTITVKPQISQDGLVTLELSPNFTAPGAQADANLPPSILTRSFQSTIRVKDGETVVLGGLSRESTGSSTTGLPVLSRVPILKWLFGTNTREKQKNSLLIYITPTVYYN